MIDDRAAPALVDRVYAGGWTAYDPKSEKARSIVKRATRPYRARKKGGVAGT